LFLKGAFRQIFIHAKVLTHVFEGDKMSGNPLEIFTEFDPKVLESWKKLQELTFAEGALSAKSKLLIAMAIDVEHGAMQGAIAIGKRAINLGASQEEIVEALRVAYSIGGNRALFTSALVLQALFKSK
jgi:alkylhydroperoxidase/carboxymuconolactone decarboxylase family protein YurZ